VNTKLSTSLSWPEFRGSKTRKRVKTKKKERKHKKKEIARGLNLQQHSRNQETRTDARTQWYDEAA